MATVYGYSLQDMAGNELQRMQTIPNPMQLPNGDQVHGASPGWTNGTYQLVEISWEEPDPPVPVPEIISNRQFYQALTADSTITKDEALNAVKTGALPLSMQQALDAMPPDRQFNAEMMMSGATAFERSHPGTIELMTALGFNAQQTDDLWRYAITL
jgi:hypothetical protein